MRFHFADCQTLVKFLMISVRRVIFRAYTRYDMADGVSPQKEGVMPIDPPQTATVIS